MTVLSKILFVSVFSLVSVQAYGKTIADVASAACTSAKGGFLTVDAQKNILVGKFDVLNEMKGSDDPDAKIELIVDYPDEGFTSLGALAIDENGYWGNLSLIAPTTQQLLVRDTLNAFFTDMEGNAIVEPMECDLVFN
jgi:hypothetical protein